MTDFFSSVRSMRLATIAASEVAPINTVSKDGDIVFLPNATQEERAAAQAILDNWVDPPDPDWDAFLDALDVELMGVVANSSMASLITARLSRLADGASWGGVEDRLISAWNAAPPALNQSQRDALSASAQAHEIPLTIAADNTILAT